MKSIPIAFIFVLALGGAPVYAVHTASVVDTSGWCQYTCRDFTVVSQRSEADTAAWAANLNQFLHAMKGRLPEDPRLLGPLTMVLFSSASDFWASAPVLDNGNPMRDLANFVGSGGWGAMVASSDRESDELNQRFIFQGGVEWLLSADHRHIPHALRIGLKEVYGAYVIKNNREIFGQPPQGYTSRLQRATNHLLGNNDRFLKIEDLLSVKDMNLVSDRHGESMFFVESWGFAHFLLFSKDMAKEHAMERLLDAFARHATPHDAMREAFGDGVDTINSRFYNYIRGGDFYELGRPIEPAPLVGSPAPADPAFVASVLARLEVIAHHPDVARSYAEQAIRMAPDDVRPREALALVDYSAGRHAEAAADCGEAIRLGTRDGWTWEENAEEIAGVAGLGDTAGITPEKAREAINASEKAIICCKGLQRAYEFMATLIPIANHVTPDDGKFLVFGRMLMPNDGWIEIGHAQWARRVHDQSLALAIIGDVLSRSASLTPQEIERARILQREWTSGSG